MIAWGTLAPATPPQVTTSVAGTTHSYDVTCTADTDVVVIFAASYNTNAVSGDPANRASATWDESPLTELAWYTQGGSFSDDQPLQAWLVVSPGAGTHALEITLPASGGSATREFLSMAIPLEGVDLDQLPTAFHTAGATTGTSPSITVNDVTAGDLILTMGTTWDIGQSAHTGTVLARYDEEADNSAYAAWNVQAAFAESTSVTIGWTAASSDDWMIVALRFVPAAGGGPEEKSTAGTVTLDLATTGASAKTAGVAGTVALDLSVADDAAKLAATAGTAAVDLDVAATAAKDAVAAATVDLALTVVGDADKVAAAAGTVGLSLEALGAVEALPEDASHGSVVLALAVAAAAAKLVDVAGAVDLDLAATGAAAKVAHTAGTVALTLDATGATSIPGAVTAVAETITATVATTTTTSTIRAATATTTVTQRPTVTTSLIGAAP